MSDREAMSGTHDCGGDAAAYALGALGPEEAEAFRAHMQECAVCRDEVEALGGVVQALTIATPQYEAPRGLRRRVMHEVRLEQAQCTTRGTRGCGSDGRWLGASSVAGTGCSRAQPPRLWQRRRRRGCRAHRGDRGDGDPGSAIRDLGQRSAARDQRSRRTRGSPPHASWSRPRLRGVAATRYRSARPGERAVRRQLRGKR